MGKDVNPTSSNMLDYAGKPVAGLVWSICTVLHKYMTNRIRRRYMVGFFSFLVCFFCLSIQWCSGLISGSTFMDHFYGAQGTKWDCRGIRPRSGMCKALFTIFLNLKCSFWNNFKEFNHICREDSNLWIRIKIFILQLSAKKKHG